MTSLPNISCVDLFCGAGELTCGLEQVGIDVRAGIDSAPMCEHPYAANNNAPFHLASIEDVFARDVIDFWSGGEVSLLAACAPCQPFSTHTQKGKTLHNLKTPLLNHIRRLIRETRPDIVVMENVPLLLRVRAFVEFISTIQNSGYSIAHGVLNTADYGVPQSRKRLILLASRLGKIHLPPPEIPLRPKTVRDAIGGLPPIPAGGRCDLDQLHQASELSPLNLERIRASIPGKSWRDWPPHLVNDCHSNQDRISWRNVYGRMGWHLPAPTITTRFYTYGCGRFGHPEQDRALSLREGALLQSFPAGYEFVPPETTRSKRDIARLIGNAVPPALAKAIGKAVVQSVCT